MVVKEVYKLNDAAEIYKTILKTLKRTKKIIGTITKNNRNKTLQKKKMFEILEKFTPFI